MKIDFRLAGIKPPNHIFNKVVLCLNHKSTLTHDHFFVENAGKSASEKPYTQLNVTVPQEMTSQLKASAKPVMVNIETEGSLAEAAREGKANSPVVESLAIQLPSKIKAEEIATVEKNTPSFTEEKGATSALTIEIPESKLDWLCEH